MLAVVATHKKQFRDLLGSMHCLMRTTVRPGLPRLPPTATPPLSFFTPLLSPLLVLASPLSPLLLARVRPQHHVRNEHASRHELRLKPEHQHRLLRVHSCNRRGGRAHLHAAAADLRHLVLQNRVGRADHVWMELHRRAYVADAPHR